MTSITMKTAAGATGDERRAPRRDLRHRAERRGDAPGRHRAARGQAGRHAQHQDPRRGVGWRRQAVAAEGHRSRPSGFDPLAAVARRRCGARPQAARLLAAHAEEDGAPRAAFGAVRPRGRGARSSSSTSGASPSPRPRRPCRLLAISASARRASGRPRVLLVLFRNEPEVWKSFRNLGERVQIILPEELNAYDVLVNDWIVFSRASLDTTVARLTGTETRRR